MQSRPLLQTTEKSLISLPLKPKKIGIFLSGGLDSALLYHFLTKANPQGLHTVIPITVPKNNRTLEYVKSILLFYGYTAEPMVLNGLLPQAITQCYDQGFDRVYVGTIKELPEFLINWNSSTYPETKFFRTPFKDLDKKQIVELVRREKLDKLFELTHSCAQLDSGRCLTCNRCRERKWAFDSLDLVDPGVL